MLDRISIVEAQPQDNDRDPNRRYFVTLYDKLYHRSSNPKLGIS